MSGVGIRGFGISGWAAVTLTNQPAFSDSPWFWAYLFAVAALIGLALINPKYAERQAQLERQFEGRQGGAGAAPSPPEDERPPRVTLQPLYFGMAAVTVVVWVLHWRRRTKRTEAGEQKSEVGSAESR